MDKLFTLLELQHQAQAVQSRDALLHIIVNETTKIVSYTQAVFWSVEGLTLQLEKVSGNAALDPQGLFASDLKKSLRQEMKAPEATVTLLTPEMHKSHGAVLMFRTAEEGLLGGLWLESASAYNEAEKRILEELALSYAQCLALWNLRGTVAFFSGWKKNKNTKYAISAAILLLVFFPVRLNITAPAEIVAKEAEIVTAPFDGMVEKIHVEPGDAVKKDDLLVTMEHQSLQAQMDLAEQEMLVVQSALSRVQRESLAAPDKKMNLTELQEEIESKKISYDYAKSLKDRSEIHATRDGVAVFSEANALRGKPVHTGEKIMTIADPAAYELLVRVPVDAMVPIAKTAHVRFFLNISPLSGYSADIRSIGYQASMDADGLLTYKIMADLPDEDKDLRIGWKGTAKIKGEWTTLSYAILRRPVISLRNLLGI